MQTCGGQKVPCVFVVGCAKNSSRSKNRSRFRNFLAKRQGALYPRPPFNYFSAKNNAMKILLFLLLNLASAARPKFSWETVPTFIHCSNASGELNQDAVSAMSQASYTVLEKFQCLSCAPEESGAEAKILSAAAAIRKVNPEAAVFLYYQVDLARTWYDSGAFFDKNPYLEVHNANGSLASSEGWHVYDFAKEKAIAVWSASIAKVVQEGNLDGVFVDGYRGGLGWADGLVPNASAEERLIWTSAAWNKTGVALASALADVAHADAILIPNGSPALSSPPGFADNQSIEFFSPYTLADLEAVRKAGQRSRFQEVHAYVGDNKELFELTLAAFLVSAGDNSYFGAGNTWDSCDSWLIKSQLETYRRPLGDPTAPATCKGSFSPSSTFYSCARNFSSGTTAIFTFNKSKGNRTDEQFSSCIRWSDGGATSGRGCSEHNRGEYILEQ